VVVLFAPGRAAGKLPVGPANFQGPEQRGLHNTLMARVGKPAK